MVADQRKAPSETQRGKRLVGTRLVRLVEDHDVEVHVGDARRRCSRARREIAVRLEKAWVVLVVAAEFVDRRVHALGTRHTNGAHARRAGKTLERVVDGEIAVRCHENPFVGVDREASLHRLNDDCRLAVPGGPWMNTA